MILKPIFTEKSTAIAKTGKYSFWVDTNMTKTQIKALVNEAFNVKVTNIRTVNLKSETRRTIRGNFQTIKARKKAIVTLAQGQTIDLFEDKNEKKKTKTRKAKK